MNLLKYALAHVISLDLRNINILLVFVIISALCGIDVSPLLGITVSGSFVHSQ